MDRQVEDAEREEFLRSLIRGSQDFPFTMPCEAEPDTTSTDGHEDEGGSSGDGPSGCEQYPDESLQANAAAAAESKVRPSYSFELTEGDISWLKENDGQVIGATIRTFVPKKDGSVKLRFRTVSALVDAGTTVEVAQCRSDVDICSSAEMTGNDIQEKKVSSSGFESAKKPLPVGKFVRNTAKDKIMSESKTEEDKDGRETSTTPQKCRGTSPKKRKWRPKKESTKIIYYVGKSLDHTLSFDLDVADTD